MSNSKQIFKDTLNLDSNVLHIILAVNIGLYFTRLVVNKSFKSNLKELIINTFMICWLWQGALHTDYYFAFLVLSSLGVAFRPAKSIRIDSTHVIETFRQHMWRFLLFIFGVLIIFVKIVPIIINSDIYLGLLFLALFWFFTTDELKKMTMSFYLNKNSKIDKNIIVIVWASLMLLSVDIYG